MDKDEIRNMIATLYESTEGNFVTEKMDPPEALLGLSFFEPPLVGFGSADDELYRTFKDPAVIGPWHRLPSEWLPGAKTVVSLFFPFTEAVRLSNRKNIDEPSDEWLWGRIEGQAYIAAFTRALADFFRARGFEACAPCVDGRFESYRFGQGLEAYPESSDASFGSNWSERHTAYVCGLGTFGLSKGLITEKGMAGRFTSVIVSAELPADPRPYSGVYDYCIRCGACIRRCPAGAISLENGKDHRICAPLLKEFRLRYSPRYGCGKCQVGVPCETCIPK